MQRSAGAAAPLNAVPVPATVTALATVATPGVARCADAALVTVIAPAALAANFCAAQDNAVTAIALLPVAGTRVSLTHTADNTAEIAPVTYLTTAAAAEVTVTVIAAAAVAKMVDAPAAPANFDSLYL